MTELLFISVNLDCLVAVGMTSDSSSLNFLNSCLNFNNTIVQNRRVSLFSTLVCVGCVVWGLLLKPVDLKNVTQLIIFVC